MTDDTIELIDRPILRESLCADDDELTASLARLTAEIAMELSGGNGRLSDDGREFIPGPRMAKRKMSPEMRAMLEKMIKEKGGQQ